MSGEGEEWGVVEGELREELATVGHYGDRFLLLVGWEATGWFCTDRSYLNLNQIEMLFLNLSCLYTLTFARISLFSSTYFN